MNRRVVITGTGLVTPLGTGVEKSWEGLVAGKNAIGAITRFDCSQYETRIAGEVKDFAGEEWVDRRELRRLDPCQHFGLAASEMAMRESGLVVTEENCERIGCIVGSGIGGLASLEEAIQRLRDKGPSRISPFFMTQMLINLAPGNISIKYGIKGPNWSPVSACATGAHAIGEAMRLIRYGECDAAIAGSTEAPISPLGIAGFNAMKAMCTDRNDTPAVASRPFDRDRSGFIPAEGAGIVVLESLEHAQRRGAKIIAELIGYGSCSDAYHVSAPEPEGVGAARCIRRALEDARVAPDQVGYINAHGTSTPLNDVNETQGIKRIFGAHAQKLAISSSKSMIGHLLGAAGSVETIITALALSRGVMPPTINYETPDPECDLDYVPNVAREAKFDIAMSNSFGFGGANAVLVLKRFGG